MSPVPKRRIFFATKLTQAQLWAEFADILNKYAQADAPEDAEFVILDLDHPPDDWANYIKRRSVPGVPISPDALIPCLVRCSSAAPGIATVIASQLKNSFNCERLSNTPSELLADLQWLESMIPYVKVKMTPEQMQQVRLVAMATGPFGGS